MFAGHLPELLIVLVLALVVFGPKRLPEIGGSLGKGIREFKKSTSELHDSVTGTDVNPGATRVQSAVPPPEVRSVHQAESPVPPPAASTTTDQQAG